MWDYSPNEKKIQDLSKRIANETAPFTNLVNCAAAVVEPFLPVVKPEDVKDVMGLGEKTADLGAEAANSESEQLMEEVDRLRKWHKKSAPTLQQASKFKWLGLGLKSFGYALSAKEAWDNLNGCQDK